MNKNKIFVFDDDDKLNRKYRKKLKTLKEELKLNFEFESLSETEFIDEIKILTKRRSSFRKGKDFEYEDSILDEASVFIIDYDLLDLMKNDSVFFLTGENVAYLARCYSRCGLIIGLNQFGPKDFDLTLEGHPESYADIDLGGRQIDNKGLWINEFEGFRPWSWPMIPDYLDKFDEKVKEITEDPNKKIDCVLGKEEIINDLSTKIIGFIGDDPLKTSFKDFVLKSENGLSSKDRKGKPTDEMIGRIAASRISKWIEQMVLPGQDVLVDAPHLVSRFPSLLSGKRDKIEDWNKTTAFKSYNKLGLSYKKIEEFRFKNENWLSRQAWYWKDLSNCDEIIETLEPWKRGDVEWVFCEDTSSFHHKEGTKEFIADFESSFVRRYVREIKGVNYKPIVKLYR